jgi:glycosyltransferase involved in cell wall biosynthesis
MGNTNLISPQKLPQRVLVVIASLAGGGAERVASDLTGFLAAAGKDVSLLTLNGDDPDAYPVPEGVSRHRIETRRNSRSIFDTIRFAIWRLWVIRQKIRSLRPDIVISFVDQTNILVAASLAGSGIPLAVSERIHPAHHPISRSWAFARRLLYRRAETVAVQTRAIASWFTGNVPVRSVCVIPNAVRPVNDFTPASSQGEAAQHGPYVLAAGRLVSQKGFDLLLQSFALSGLATQGWKLVILGEGPDRGALQALAGKLDISAQLYLPGRRNDVPDWLANAGMFVLSSRYEGFPNALLEAMQMGCPCISFNCESGPDDIIRDRENGILVAPQDFETLAAEMKNLAKSPALRAQLGEAARSSALQQFSCEKIYHMWIDLIDRHGLRRS